MKPFKWSLPAAKICYKLLQNWSYIGFQTGHFADFEYMKIDSHFADFLLWASQNYTTDFLYWFWAGHSCYTEFGQDFRLRKTMQKKNSGNTNRIWHTSFSMIQSAIIKGIGPPGNKKTSKVQSFSFCNTFFWFVW